MLFECRSESYQPMIISVAQFRMLHDHMGCSLVIVGHQEVTMMDRTRINQRGIGLRAETRNK